MDATKVLPRPKAKAPQLRFKGFTDDWKKISLGDCITLLTDYHANGSYEKLKENVELLEEENYAVMIRTTNFEKKDYSNNLNFISESAYNYLKKSKVFTDDIIINKIANAGATYIMPELNRPVSLAMNLFLLRVNNQNSPKYIYSQIKTKEHLLRSLASGTGTKTITKDDVRGFEIKIPTLAEQQKIASFLSAVDEKLQQLTHKKELLEQFKKGVMQQLFSGKLRFKDDNGKAFPKWEEKLYSDVYSFYSTNSFSRDNLNYESGSVKNIHYGDIHTKFKSLFDVTKETVPFINDDIDISKIKEDNYCKAGDLVIADASEDYADIGKSIELIKLNNEKVIAGLHTFLARPNKIKIYKGFSGHLVKASYVRKQVMTIAQGTKVLSLSTSRLGNVKLNIPCLEEQKKITNYLSNIDSKMEIINKQITQTQTFKKGLLQQMFV